MARFSKGVSRLHARESREAIRARYLGADEGSRNRAEREENPRDGRERQNDLGPGKGTRFDQGLHQRLWEARREAARRSPIQVQARGTIHCPDLPLVGRISPQSHRGGEAVDEGPSRGPLATNVPRLEPLFRIGLSVSVGSGSAWKERKHGNGGTQEP